MQLAKHKKIIPDFQQLSNMEQIEIDEVIKGIASGRMVIYPSRFNSQIIGIGDGLRSKILFNFGTSSESPNIDNEIEKIKCASNRGASILCDQSVGPHCYENRKKVIGIARLPIASVPLYQTVENAKSETGNSLDFNAEDLIENFKLQLEQGVVAPGIHTMTRKLNDLIKSSNRLMPTVSRGGTILSKWIENNEKENPYVSNFDKILDFCFKFNVPLTFISSCRSGCLADGFDSIQVHEWKIIRGLVERAHEKGVSCIVDGLGHMNMNQIRKAVLTVKKICHHIPLGVMGPVPSDRALGYEHIGNAIGTAVAVAFGANYCQSCARTEHLGIPEACDVPDTIGASLLATYIGDLSKYGERYANLDRKMSEARVKNQWGKQLALALEPVGARETFERVGPKNKEGKGCSICGDLCPFVVRHAQTNGKTNTQANNQTNSPTNTETNAQFKV